MSRLPLIQPDTVDGQLAEFYDATTEMIGRVPHSVRSWANSPFIAMLMLPFNVAVQREWPGTELPGRLKELAVIKTSQINECAYCYAHNTSLGQAAGITDEHIIALSGHDFWISDLFDERERLAIAWAEHVTRNTAAKNDELYAKLEEHFSPAEIVELTFVVAMFNMINRLNDSLAMTIEDQAEVDRIRGTLHADPARMGEYLRWLADHWPKDFDTLKGEARVAAGK